MRNHKSINLKSAARLELFARQHRCCLTESEARLWSALKACRLGVSFRRQVPVVGQFIADFCAPSIGLIVEVDGPIHARKPGPDARRDLKLRRAGFRIVRVSAELVLRDLGAAVAVIRAALAAREITPASGVNRAHVCSVHSARPSSRAQHDYLPLPRAAAARAASTALGEVGGAQLPPRRGGGEHRRVPPSLSGAERGGNSSCGEGGIRTLGRRWR